MNDGRGAGSGSSAGGAPQSARLSLCRRGRQARGKRPSRGRRSAGDGGATQGAGRRGRVGPRGWARHPSVRPGSPRAEAAGRPARAEGRRPRLEKSLPRRAAGTGGARGGGGPPRAGPEAGGGGRPRPARGPRGRPPPRAPPRPAARPRPGSRIGFTSPFLRPSPPSSGPWYAPGDRCLGIFNIWDAANAEVK